MAQVFWEQIQNELPGIGEFLTGSLNISGSFQVSGGLSIELDGIEDIFKVTVQGEDKLKVNTEGIVQLSPQINIPTPIEGGIYYSSSAEYYFGFPNT